MWAFQYKHGDRPLEGYTIQRAAGRGGFGEVYYAVSDSGREVALKVVQGYEAIELRGIGQCMNLKSPHLVSIFDVRHNHEGKPFVIMEYVSGLNLRQLLDESPAGLGTQKAAFFLREIAKGLAYLHECGIVHRDLKPANIFYENGYVKIGDYGLSKHITTSQYSGQTVTVGTVHYMAPEIGAGKYDRSIDIYAMGALLYEMLTGTPPYLGSSPSEVLMKHLSSEPDVSGIPQPFARVIQKAMAKDPAQRYQGVQEMVEDVFGAEHVRQSVSVFAPEDLSVIAERVAKRATVAVGAGAGGGGGGGAEGGGASSSMPGGAPADTWARLGNWMDGVGGRVKQMWHEPNAVPPGSAAPAGAGPVNYAAAPIVVNDPLSNRHRWQVALLVSAIAPLAAALVAPRTAMGYGLNSFFFVLSAMWGAALGLILAHRAVMPRWDNDSTFLQRLVAGQCAAMGAVLLSLPTWGAGSWQGVGGTLIAVLAPLFVTSTKDQMAWDRSERVRFGNLFGAGLAAFILSMIFRGQWQLAVAVSAGASLIVQVLAPWDPQAGARTKKLKEAIEKAEEDGDEAKVAELKAARAAAPGAAAGAPVVRAVAIDARNGTVKQVSPHAVAAGKVKQYANAHYGGGSAKRYWSRPVWPFARVAWVIGIVAFLTMGVMFCVAGGTTRRVDEVGPYVAAGVSSFLFGLLCIVRALTTVFYGWWGYFLKPLVMTACASAIASSAIVLGNIWYPPTEDDIMLGTFFIVFPALLLIVLLFIPGKWPDRGADRRAQQPVTSTGPSPYQRRWALLLSALMLAGFGGLHRIYVGKIITGILWIITGGMFLVGQIVDVVMILSGDFKDKRGRKLRYWEAPGGDLSAAPAPPPPPIPQGAPDAPGTPEAPEVPQSGLMREVECVVADCSDAVAGAFKDVGASFKATFGWDRPVEPNAAPAQPATRDSAIELNVRGLLSALAGLLLFIATLLALGLALDVPGMLYHGVPTPDIKRELEANAFAHFPDDWPHLLRKMAAVSIGVVMLLALTIQAFARQRGGVVHMIRGIVGAVGLMVAMLPLSVAVSTYSSWKDIGFAMSQKMYNGAADQLLKSLQSWPAIGAGAIFLVSVILLAWPARRAKETSSSPAYYPIDPSQAGASATVKGA